MQEPRPADRPPWKFACSLAAAALAALLLVASTVGPLASPPSPFAALARARPPRPVDALLERHAAAARARLAAGLRTPCGDRACAFDDVVVSLPLAAPDVLRAGNGGGQGAKAMLNPEALFRGGGRRGRCVVYGLGISVDSEYEVDMAAYCDEVHGFDCTISAESEAVRGKPFTFHQTCVGTASTIKETSGYGGQSWELVFKPLQVIMRELRHSRVDVMKFDIEGSEWELFEKNILDPAFDNPPMQLQFELHTRWASTAFVPAALVGKKGKREVNQLFLDLHDKGYRVISKELNGGDPACAEFSLVMVH